MRGEDLLLDTSNVLLTGGEVVLPGRDLRVGVVDRPNRSGDLGVGGVKGSFRVGQRLPQRALFEHPLPVLGVRLPVGEEVGYRLTPRPGDQVGLGCVEGPLLGLLVRAGSVESSLCGLGDTDGRGHCLLGRGDRLLYGPQCVLSGGALLLRSDLGLEVALSSRPQRCPLVLEHPRPPLPVVLVQPQRCRDPDPDRDSVQCCGHRSGVGRPPGLLGSPQR